MGKICSLRPSLGSQTVTWHSEVAQRHFGSSVLLKNPERSQQQGLKQVAAAQGEANLLPKTGRCWQLGFAFCLSFLFFSHKSLLSSPFSVPQPCLFSGLYGGVRDVWGMVMTSKCSPPSPWSFGVLKPLLFLTGCPELWRPLFCSAESSSLFTSVMFPLYPPPYIWTLEDKLGFVYSFGRWLDSDLTGT